jgi:hypothetical protein
MQLEGGTEALVPEAVRVLDRDEHVIEARLCLPLAAAEAHGIGARLDLTPVAWVVVSIPEQTAADFETGLPWDCSFQAKIGDEWLALDLVDTGCRLGRARAISAS